MVVQVEKEVEVEIPVMHLVEKSVLQGIAMQ
jgi:hypothetical protein